MTIYDIAKEAGVSASTVSRVINGKPGISEKTRKKVSALLEKYNYALNLAARGLSTSATGMIGILLEDIRNAHHAQIAYNLEQQFTNLGYSAIIASTGSSEEKRKKVLHFMSARQVDGLILVGSTYQNDFMKEAIARLMPQMPVVIANGWLDLPNVYGVLMDEKKGVEDCVDLLFERGYGRLAFCMTSETPSSRLKLEGALAAIRRHGQRDEDLVILRDCGEVEDGARAADLLLDEYRPVQAVIFGEDPPAMGCLRRMAERGELVPERLAVIGIDNSSLCSLSHPMLTSLDNRPVQMCEAVVRMMTDVLGAGSSLRTIQLPCSLKIRGSV